MKELFDSFIAVIPKYLRDLLGVATTPKRFLVERATARKPNWTDGLVFFGVSVAITEAFSQLALHEVPGEKSAITVLAAQAMFAFVWMALFGFAVYLAWRSVGAVAAIDRVFLIHFYVTGVLKLMMTVTVGTAFGFLRAVDSKTYQALLEKGHSDKFAEWIVDIGLSGTFPPALMQTAIVIFFGCGVMLSWLIVTWGAYRQLSNLRAGRSLAAFLVFLVLAVPTTVVTALLANALQ